MKKLLLTLFLLLPSSLFSAGIDDFSHSAHWSCDETSGVRYDSNLTNTNDLTDNNTVLYGTGLLSNACDFESTASEYLSISDANQVGLDTSTHSISFWVKFESATPRGFIQRGTSGTLSYNFQIDSNTLYYASWDSGGADGGNFSKAFTPTLGSWYHIVLIRDQVGNNCDLYINGTDQSVTCTTLDVIYDSSQDTRIGYANTNYFDGLMDEITFFDIALTSTDVTTLYNSGTPLDYQGTGDPPTSTTTTSTSTANMSDTNFLLVIIIFFLTFFFLTLAFSIFKKSK